MKRRALVLAAVALAGRRRDIAARTICHHTPEFRRKANDPIMAQLRGDMEQWTGSLLADVYVHPGVAMFLPVGGMEMIGGTVFRLKLGDPAELGTDFWWFREVCLDPGAV